MCDGGGEEERGGGAEKVVCICLSLGEGGWGAELSLCVLRPYLICSTL